MSPVARGTLVFSTICIILGFAMIQARTGAPSSQSKKGHRKNAEQVLAKGREVYTANCARCHGDDGLGKTTLGEMTEAPDIANARFQSRRSDRRLTQSVMRGRGQMPAFGAKLTKEEIAAAIVYVRSLKK